jgi:hypothetical protein
MRTHFAIATRTGASENGPQPTSTTTEETDAARIDRWKAENTENAAQAHVNTKSLQPGGGLRMTAIVFFESGAIIGVAN